MSKKEVTQLFADAGIDIDIPDKDKFKGKEIFSLLLPKKLNLEYRAACCRNCDVCKKTDCEYDAWVKTKNGDILTGTIDASSVGAFKGKVISKLHEFCDRHEIKEFIDKAGRLGIAFLMKRGLSLGISDLDLPKDVMERIQEEVTKAEINSDNLIEQYNKRELRILPGMTSEESLEAQILNTLATGVSRVSDIVSENIKQNDILVMTESGAKGSIINTTQMAAVVGQETVLGKRINTGYYRRTLPHISPGDLSARSHGFVARGFKQGLTPFELFWNIMNGREGLMDKSLRTRKSGYMQRRLVNALQDLKVNDDYTVRNAHSKVVQFMVGEDGIDPSKSSWGKLRWEECVGG